MYKTEPKAAISIVMGFVISQCSVMRKVTGFSASYNLERRRPADLDDQYHSSQMDGEKHCGLGIVADARYREYGKPQGTRNPIVLEIGKAGP